MYRSHDGGRDMAVRKARKGRTRRISSKGTDKAATPTMLAVQPATAPTPRAAKKRTASEVRRRLRAAELWPNADEFRWKRSEETGFTTIPRTLTLVASLIK